MNPFSEIHKKLSNFELQEIINHADDYQEAAVISAQNELKNRNLSEDDFQQIQQQIAAADLKQVQTVIKQKEKQQAFINKVIHYANIYLHGNSKKYGIQTQINIIATLFFLNAANSLLAVDIYNGKLFFIYQGAFSFYLLAIVLPAVVLIITGIFLRKHIKAGWVAAFLILVFFLIFSAYNWYQITFNFQMIANSIFMPSGKPNAVIPFITTILCGVGIYVLSKKSVLSLFHLTIKSALLLIAATLFVLTCVFVSYYDF
jgi:hypothetical protein